MTRDTTADNPRAIKVDQIIAHPPAKVWRALTEPELVARRPMPNDFKPEVGHRFTFTTAPKKQIGFDGVVHCQVLEIQEQRLLKLSWSDGGRADWTVTWRLVPEGRGTRLFIDHEGFDPDDELQQLSRRIMGGGWRNAVLRTIAAVVDEL
ncbi:SRPBCC domain-containing protein [Nonomuraea sp. KC401]|uniref:SRPBCC family protein n=1 Tax=unclassified Nonomuraea TaxID=2593643 RepID=UPI0010FDF365|nr:MULTISPECIES: SRPBCC domain-containing protein [unclassified Nonomuraea]NBE94901.1 SRPBCC domain-containing protein [Nonomuraea sp. K271]TLF72245.1 SRPBCC domain-containing protein [Nonomuraea sp. KC401]